MRNYFDFRTKKSPFRVFLIRALGSFFQNQCIFYFTGLFEMLKVEQQHCREKYFGFFENILKIKSG